MLKGSLDFYSLLWTNPPSIIIPLFSCFIQKLSNYLFELDVHLTNLREYSNIIYPILFPTIFFATLIFFIFTGSIVSFRLFSTEYLSLESYHYLFIVININNTSLISYVRYYTDIINVSGFCQKLKIAWKLNLHQITKESMAIKIMPHYNSERSTCTTKQ